MCVPPPPRGWNKEPRGKAAWGGGWNGARWGTASPRFPRSPPNVPRGVWAGKERRPAPRGFCPGAGLWGPLHPLQGQPAGGEGARGAGSVLPGKARGFGLHFPGTGRGVRGVPGARLPLTLRGARAQTRIHRRSGPHFSRNNSRHRGPVPVEKAPRTYGFPAPPHSDCSQFLGGCGRRP